MLEQPMRSSLPEWVGAIWVGEIDVSHLETHPPGSVLGLTDGTPYRRARLLVRHNQTLAGFVTVDVHDGTVSVDELRAQVAQLPDVNPEPDPPTPPISVVICTKDRGPLLQQAIDSVLASHYPRFEVVVVDNASATSQTRDVAENHPDPRVRYLVEPIPGVSYGRNRGLRAAVNEYVAFLDDDVVVDRHWLTGIARGFSRDPRVGLVCGLVPSGELRTETQAWFDHRVTWANAYEPRVYTMADPPPELPLFPFQVGAFGTGANNAVTKTAFERVGGFDVRLGPGQPTKGAEDIDLYVRILLEGFGLAVEPSAIAWHRHRSDLPALQAQARGYGAGMGAWLTKIMLTPSLLRHAVPRVPGALRRLRSIAQGGSTDPDDADQRFGLPAGYTARLGRLEARSAVTGPLRFAQAQWAKWRGRH